jgi:dihydrofolate reductase
VRPLRFSVNVTLDGCYDHEAVPADEHLHRFAADSLARSDAMLLGRATFDLMRSAFSTPSPDDPFAVAIDAVPKHVVSRTLDHVGWDAELVRGDLAEAVRRLQEAPGLGIAVGGVQLAFSLAELGLIDEYELVVHPRITGRGPTLFAGLSEHVDLVPVWRHELASGAVATRYEPRR